MRSCFRGKVQPGKMYDSRPKSSLKYVTGSTLGTGAVNGGFYSELDSASNRGNILSVCLHLCVCVGGNISRQSVCLSICHICVSVCLPVCVSLLVCPVADLGAGILNLDK